MKVAVSSGRVVRFSIFELDLRSGELRKKGLKIKLQEQPFQVLAMLLERPGQVVTREELQQKLWPEGTFVDYEQGLNVAIKKLREALGDSAESPRFVETLARRGYRFIGQRPQDSPEDERAELGGSTDAQSAGRLVSSKAESKPRRRFGPRAVGVLVLTMLVASGGFYWLARRDRATHETINSLAILPFTNAGGDAASEYLSDGITESLINNFSRLRQLRVVARATAFRHKGQERNPQEIGRHLKVGAVLMGRILQRGDSLNVQAELVDVSDGSQLWGAQFQRQLTDLLVLQEEIAREISEKLRLQLTGEQQKRLTRRYTESAEAYQLYLKGRYHWNKRTTEGLNKGIEYFKQAIGRDSNFALCYAGLADSYNMLPGYGLASPKDSFPQAKEAARTALKIDISLADAHTALAFALMHYDWNWPQAEREFKLAIELNPSYAFAHQWYAIYLQSMQRRNEAIAEIKQALELEPLSLAINTGVSWVFCWAGRYDEAIDAAKTAVELDPSFAMGHVRLALAYEQKQLYEKAIHEAQIAVTLSNGNSVRLSELAHIYGASGQRGKAKELINELTQRSSQRYVPAQDFAWVYTGLGDREPAFAWWQKAYEERGMRLAFLQGDPGFNAIRSDPRFAELVRRVGLPP
jgi:TolB-like protein/DNA-binding winged helix-turn-helix (wHTH) protein/Flp pilus assembly protein TadD